MSVIQTGSIAMLAFIFGDFFSQVVYLGPFSAVIYASAAVIVLTGINIAGLRTGTGTQKALTAVEVLGVLLVAAAGFFFAPPHTIPDVHRSEEQTSELQSLMRHSYAVLCLKKKK